MRTRSGRGGRWRIGTALGIGLALAGPSPQARAADEARASVRVSAPPDAVWALLVDFAHWHQVFPTVDRIDVEAVDARRVLLHTRTRVVGHTVRYTLAADVDAAARRIDCTLDPGAPSDVRALASRWRVHGTADGGSRVELSVRSDSGLGLPRFLERRVTELSTRQTLDALVRALDEQRRASGAPRVATRLAAAR